MPRTERTPDGGSTTAGGGGTVGLRAGMCGKHGSDGAPETPAAAGADRGAGSGAADGLRRPRRGRSHSGCRHGLAQVGGSRVGARRCTGHRQTRSWLRTGRRRILRTAKQRTRCRADRLAEDAPTLRRGGVGLGRDLLAFRIGRPHQVIRVGLLGQGGVDEVLRLVGLQLGQDGDQAATEHGRDLRKEREELLVGGVLQRVLKAGREHRSTTRGIL